VNLAVNLSRSDSTRRSKQSLGQSTRKASNAQSSATADEGKKDGDDDEEVSLLFHFEATQ